MPIPPRPPAQPLRAGDLNTAVLLLRDAIDAADAGSMLDDNWFRCWRAWQQTNAQATPTTRRLQHPLALFAAQAIDENMALCTPLALAGFIYYLNALQSTTSQELTVPIWLHDEDLQRAYEAVVHEEFGQAPWIVPPSSTIVDPSKKSLCVLDVVIGVLKVFNLGVEPNTVYRHCAPLLVRLLNQPGWSPCALAAHFYALRTTQFKHLNASCTDLPGEAHTVHGLLAQYQFAYMHSSAWRPSRGEDTGVLNRLVWDVLCLTDLGSQSIGWLDTLANGLPNAGLSELYASMPREMPTWGRMTPIHTPAFFSLSQYTKVARQDLNGPFNRAHAFERRHHRLAHAMQTYLMVLPGSSAVGDWDALNEWWRVDVQGLPPTPNGVLELPCDFECAVH